MKNKIALKFIIFLSSITFSLQSQNEKPLIFANLGIFEGSAQAELNYIYKSNIFNVFAYQIFKEDRNVPDDYQHATGGFSLNFGEPGDPQWNLSLTEQRMVKGIKSEQKECILMLKLD